MSGTRLRLKHRAPRTVLLIPKWQTSRDEEGGTGPTMRIILGNPEGEVRTLLLSELLPEGFTPAQLLARMDETEPG